MGKSITLTVQFTGDIKTKNETAAGLINITIPQDNFLYRSGSQKGSALLFQTTGKGLFFCSPSTILSARLPTGY